MLLNTIFALIVVQLNIKDLGDFAELMTNSFEDLSEDTVAKANEYLEKLEKMDRGEASMVDYVHRCIRCDSTAVDVNDGHYKCTDCGFEWEVVKFE